MIDEHVRILYNAVVLLKIHRNRRCLSESKSDFTDHSIGVKAIRTAGSTADDRISDLLIELKAQFYKLVTL